MSLRVAVACEDHTHDQYVVKPVVEMLLGATGFQRAHVRVITDPRINGIEDLKANACAKTVVVAADRSSRSGHYGEAGMKSAYRGAKSAPSCIRKRFSLTRL